MLGKTHMTVGIAATLAITRPNSIPELLLGTSFAVLGSLISDIDAENSASHRKANYVTLAAIGIAAAVLATDRLFNSHITERLLQNTHTARLLIGSLIFIAACAFGKEQPHRSFMHSFLALAILSISLGMVLPMAAPYFTVGFCSHLAVDLLNHKKVRLLYPFHGGLCFDLCSAKGLVNRLFFIAGCIFSVSEFAILTFQIIIP